MTTSEMIEQLSQQMKLSKKDIHDVICMALSLIGTSLQNGDEIKLRQIGTLYTRPVNRKKAFGNDVKRTKSVKFRQSRKFII